MLYLKVLTYFRFVFKNIFTSTAVKYRFLCIFSRIRFLFTAFDCAGSRIFERPESFLQVVTLSLLFTVFDCPRSKIYEGESFLGLSQSLLFIAFCDKRSGTGELAESFLGYIFLSYQADLGLGHVKHVMISRRVQSFCNRVSGARYLYQNCCNV